MITHRARPGETVRATSTTGIMAINGQKFGMKLSAHASNANKSAYGIHMIANHAHVATATITMAISCHTIHFHNASYISYIVFSAFFLLLAGKSAMMLSL